jgi:hypothetical protein
VGSSFALAALDHEYCKVQAHSFMGKDDPTQDPLHFVLNTTAAIGKLHHDVPILPHGNLVTGLPAAVFSFCQVCLFHIHCLCAACTRQMFLFGASNAFQCQSFAVPSMIVAANDIVVQVHDLPATLLLSVDAAPLPDGIAIRAYAQCTADVLQSTGQFCRYLRAAASCDVVCAFSSQSGG